MPSSRSRSSGSGSGSRPPLNPPVSERQQLALVMQMTSQERPPRMFKPIFYIHMSHKNGQLQIRAIFVLAPPNPVEERKRGRAHRNERGETPLHVAAIRGDQEQVQKLIDQGEDPDSADFAGKLNFFIFIFLFYCLKFCKKTFFIIIIYTYLIFYILFFYICRLINVMCRSKVYFVSCNTYVFNHVMYRYSIT